MPLSANGKSVGMSCQPGRRPVRKRPSSGRRARDAQSFRPRDPPHLTGSRPVCRRWCIPGSAAASADTNCQSSPATGTRPLPAHSGVKNDCRLAAYPRPARPATSCRRSPVQKPNRPEWVAAPRRMQSRPAASYLSRPDCVRRILTRSANERNPVSALTFVPSTLAQRTGASTAGMPRRRAM